jgi:hypothetical protein
MFIPNRDDLSNWEIIPVLPTIQTQVPSTTNNTATLQGQLFSDGGVPLIDCGFRYGTTVDCINIISLKEIDKIPHTLSYQINVSGDSTYYVRTFATNSVGTTEGETITFAPPSGLASVSINPTKFINNGESYPYANRWRCYAEGTITDNGNCSILDYGFIIKYKPASNDPDPYSPIKCWSAVTGGSTLRISGESNVFNVSTSNDFKFDVLFENINTIPLNINIPYTFSMTIRNFFTDIREAYVYSYVVNTKGVSFSEVDRYTGWERVH